MVERNQKACSSLSSSSGLNARQLPCILSWAVLHSSKFCIWIQRCVHMVHILKTLSSCFHRGVVVSLAVRAAGQWVLDVQHSTWQFSLFWSVVVMLGLVRKVSVHFLCIQFFSSSVSSFFFFLWLKKMYGRVNRLNDASQRCCWCHHASRCTCFSVANDGSL